MRIGIDIDDTTLVMFDTMIKYANKYNVEELGGTELKENSGLIITNRYLEELYGWDRPTTLNFLNKYYETALKEFPECTNASKVINRLKNEGNEIYFISARLANICDVESITKESFKKYNIPYDKLIFNTPDKLETCKKYNIDIFLDDSYEVCKKLMNNGIKCYMKTSPINKNIIDNELSRFDDWEELYNMIK